GNSPKSEWNLIDITRTSCVYKGLERIEAHNGNVLLVLDRINFLLHGTRTKTFSRNPVNLCDVFTRSRAKLRKRSKNTFIEQRLCVARQKSAKRSLGLKKFAFSKSHDIAVLLRA